MTLGRNLEVFMLCACGSFLAGAGEITVQLEPVDGIYHVFPRPWPEAGKAVAPVTLRLTLKSTDGKAHEAKVKLTAADILKKPVDWKKELKVDVPADGKPATADVPFDTGMGYCSIAAEVKTDAGLTTAWTDVGTIPPSHPGVRKDSFFSSNTSSVRTGMEAKLLEAIGIKVQRSHFQPRVSARDWQKKPATGAAQPLDFKDLDRAFSEGKERGLWVLPIVGYALDGAKTPLADELGMHGPPRDAAEFVATWEQILKHYPEVTTYEFWNEPWIFGWTWAAPPEEYRKLQKMWCEMALKVNPSYRIIAGNSSMFCEDHIEHDPACWKGLLQGTTHHPYGFSTGASTFRHGDQFRSMDYGLQVTRRMGLPYYYLTEGGTEYATATPPEVAELEKQAKNATGAEKKALEAQLRAVSALFPHPKNNLENACKIVQYSLRQALIGGYQTNAQWGIGYGAEWTCSNVSIAVLTHFLEDRPVVADIWPENELICGAVFANPKHVTPEVKALPRAKELATRWEVPVPDDRANDATKVAVVYALTGLTADALDADGTLTLENKNGDLRAFNMVGRSIKADGDKLVVPLSPAPSYILSDTLSVVALRERVANGRIEKLTPINLYALSLLQPANEAQKLGVRVENQLNVAVKGELELRIGEKDAGKAEFEIPAAKLAEVPVAWPGVAPAPSNQYDVTLTAKTKTADGRSPAKVTRRQVIQVARIAKRTVALNGTLDAWKDLPPVLLDSRLLRKDTDLTQYLLNPGMDKPTGAGDEKRIVARLYAAYDAENVYLAAAVNEEKHNIAAGAPALKGRGGKKVDLPYRTGMPDGLTHIAHAGDTLQLAFGFRDRVPGFGRQMDDLYAWKGHFYDTDYVFHAHSSTDGDLLIRQWGPGQHRRNGYQTDKVPGMEPVAGAKIKITRDEEKKVTLYEIAIPRRELVLFDPAQGRCRFGFVLGNDEGLGELNWSEVAGVYDYWRNLGSFAPTWMQRLPCQTFFGIER